MKILAPILLGVFLVAGCSSPSGGARWYAPATWFSSREAATADRAVERRDEKREAVLKAAQVEVAKTMEALTVAPDSREVELARRFNGNAENLLGQSIGSIKVADLVAIRKLVADLRSENAELRTAAETLQQREEARVGQLSEQLGEATRKLAESQKDLRAAFDRENALADQLRTQRAWLWIALGAAVLGMAGWLYLKVTLGGLPGAAGQLMATLRTKHPETAGTVETLFDSLLDRGEQRAIARHAR